MDTLSYLSTDSGSYADELYSQQNFYEGAYQNDYPAGFSYGLYPQSRDTTFEETDIVESVPFLFGDISYPSYPRLTGHERSLNVQSEGFEFVDFCQSNSSSPPLASSSLARPPIQTFQSFDEATFAASVPIPLLQDAETVTPWNQQHAERKSNPNIPQQRSSLPRNKLGKLSRPAEAESPESSSTTSSKVLKKSRGPPKCLLSVFDSNAEPQTKRKSRKAFTEEGKRKVEAVRMLGACIQCRFGKRTVSTEFCQKFKHLFWKQCETNRPCQSCIRRAGDPELAKSLCTRQSPFENLSVTECKLFKSRKSR
jgi:hypothetical protein